MSSRNLIPAVCALLLTGCSTTSKTEMLEHSTMGEASRTTFAAQVIDPDPQYEFLDPPTSAEHAAQAVERYRKDAVKKPERVRSTVNN